MKIKKIRLLICYSWKKSSRGFIKIAVATITLLFTFNLISAQQYYKSEKKSIEQKVYSIYFEPINQLP